MLLVIDPEGLTFQFFHCLQFLHVLLDAIRLDFNQRDRQQIKRIAS